MDKNTSLIFYAFIMLATGFLLLLARILKEKGKEKYGILVDVLAFLPLFFMFGFRYDVGTDYFHTYVPHFSSIVNGGEVYEGGFYLINKAISLFTNNAQWLFIITGFLYTYFVVDAIRRYSDNPLISVIVLFLMSFVFIAMNNVRQQIAVAMILWGFRYIMDEKLGEYTAVCLFATFFFHTSAIFMFPIYFIINSKLIQKYFLLFGIGLVLISPLLGYLLMFVIDVLGYGYFLDSYRRESGGNFRFLMQNLSFLVVFFWTFMKKYKNDKLRYALLVFQLLSFIMGILSYSTHLIELPERIATFFMIFEVIAIPLVCKDLYKKNRYYFAVGSLFLLGSMLFLFIDGIYIKGYHEVLPYQFIFGHWHELEAIKALLI